MGTRKLITISLSSELLERAERVAQQEHRTKSELLREALRFYIDTNEVRRSTTRERLFTLIDRVQTRVRGVPPREIRKLVREAVEAARRGKRRASA